MTAQVRWLVVGAVMALGLGCKDEQPARSDGLSEECRLARRHVAELAVPERRGGSERSQRYRERHIAQLEDAMTDDFREACQTGGDGFIDCAREAKNAAELENCQGSR